MQNKPDAVRCFNSLQQAKSMQDANVVKKKKTLHLVVAQEYQN